MNKHIDYTKGSPDSPYFWRITMPMEFVEGMRLLRLTHTPQRYSPMSDVEKVLRNSFSFFFPSILFFVSIMAKKHSNNYSSLPMPASTLYSTIFSRHSTISIITTFPTYGVTRAKNIIETMLGRENSSR